MKKNYLAQRERSNIKLLKVTQETTSISPFAAFVASTPKYQLALLTLIAIASITTISFTLVTSFMSDNGPCANASKNTCSYATLIPSGTTTSDFSPSGTETSDIVTSGIDKDKNKKVPIHPYQPVIKIEFDTGLRGSI